MRRGKGITVKERNRIKKQVFKWDQLNPHSNYQQCSEDLGISFTAAKLFLSKVPPKTVPKLTRREMLVKIANSYK